MRSGRRQHVFETEINLPESLSHVFAFFADAPNLEKLTPPWLKFFILTPDPIRMKVGTLIDYRLRIRGMPVYWRTRITAWDPPHRFVDQQVCGPYRLWIHEHKFDEEVGQTLARDRVEYDVPLGILVHRLFVRRDIERIFAFRHRKLPQVFARSCPADRQN